MTQTCFTVVCNTVGQHTVAVTWCPVEWSVVIGVVSGFGTLSADVVAGEGAVGLEAAAARATGTAIGKPLGVAQGYGIAAGVFRCHTSPRAGT